MSDNHPVATVVHGDWGDDFASVRLVGESSLDLKAEAFMDQITYGHIAEETAKANWFLIAAAPDLYAALEDARIRLHGAGMLGGDTDPVVQALAKARGEREDNGPLEAAQARGVEIAVNADRARRGEGQ